MTSPFEVALWVMGFLGGRRQKLNKNPKDEDGRNLAPPGL